MAISGKTPQRKQIPDSEFSNQPPRNQPTPQWAKPPRPTTPAPMLHPRTNSPLTGTTATIKQTGDNLKAVTSPTASPTRSGATAPVTPQRTTTTTPVVKSIRPSSSRHETPSQSRNINSAGKRKATTAEFDSESADKDRYEKARRTGNATTPQEARHPARTPVSPPVSPAAQTALSTTETPGHDQVNPMILQFQESINTILVQVEILQFRRIEVDAVTADLSRALDVLVCDLDCPPKRDTTATNREAVVEHLSKLRNLMDRASSKLKTSDAMQTVFARVTEIGTLVDTMCSAPRNSAKEQSGEKRRQ